MVGRACAKRYAPRSPTSACVSTKVRTLSSRKKGAVVRQGLQEGQHRWKGVLERLVEGEHLPSDLGPDRARVVVLLHVAIAPEHVNDREVRRGLPIRH